MEKLLFTRLLRPSAPAQAAQASTTVSKDVPARSAAVSSASVEDQGTQRTEEARQVVTTEIQRWFEQRQRGKASSASGGAGSEAVPVFPPTAGSTVPGYTGTAAAPPASEPAQEPTPDPDIVSAAVARFAEHRQARAVAGRGALLPDNRQTGARLPD